MLPFRNVVLQAIEDYNEKQESKRDYISIDDFLTDLENPNDKVEVLELILTIYKEIN